MTDTKDAEITVRLVEAQADFEEKIPIIRKERQDAVLAAIAAGWSKYRVAATLGVAAPTVTSIIKAAEKEQQ